MLFLIALSACEKAGDDPTPTPDQEGIQAVGTLFAQPTRATRPTPTPTPVIETELELNRVVALMEQAVLAQEIDTYLNAISPNDPTFLVEHTRWAQDWVEHPLSVFTIDLFSIRSPSPDVAQARMTIRWSRRDTTSAGSAGGATVSAIFYHSGNTWQWGGEDWAWLDTEGIRLYFFEDEVINNRHEAELMAADLPGIYTRLTRELGFVPDRQAQIKLYDNAAAVQTMTRISQPQITSWNEPGEAIKVALDENNLPPSETQLARHFARFMLYEMAGGTHGGFPWWLEEGIAAYSEGLFRPLSQRNRIIKGVAALALDPDNPLPAWDELGSRPAWDDDSRQPIANQALTLITYITETFGTEARNAWVHTIAEGSTLEQASTVHLGLTWVELDAQWHTWLIAQL